MLVMLAKIDELQTQRLVWVVGHVHVATDVFMVVLDLKVLHHLIKVM